MKLGFLPAVCLLVFGGVAIYLLGPWDRRGVEEGPLWDDAGPGSFRGTADRGGSPAGLETATAPEHGSRSTDSAQLTEMVKVAERLNEDGLGVRADLRILQELLAVYRRELGTYPEGGVNLDIVRALRGENARQLVLIADGHGRITEEGELLDRFGTPYYFRVVSPDRIEIRSAGPDRLLWTDDDLQVP